MYQHIPDVYLVSCAVATENQHCCISIYLKNFHLNEYAICTCSRASILICWGKTSQIKRLEFTKMMSFCSQFDMQNVFFIVHVLGL